MKYNRLYAAFIFAFLAGCSGDGQYKEALLPQIDVNKVYPEKEIFLQDQRESTQIFLKNWGRRSWRQKAAESIVRLLAPLL